MQDQNFPIELLQRTKNRLYTAEFKTDLERTINLQIMIRKTSR